MKDPKLRHIHKASVRDRLVHQALFKALYSLFDRGFIHDSYSSRDFKGTHAGSLRLEGFIRKATGNWNRRAWVLKCDVRKFFDSIDHEILLGLVRDKVHDPQTMNLLDLIIRGFEKSPGKGIPLGNVTSQLFANVYMNELDQFVKHSLRAVFYARYCDDFVIVHEDRKFLEEAVWSISNFLGQRLLLELHPHKVSIRKARQGIDFLGQVILPHRRVIRTKTKRRILKKIDEKKRLFLAGAISRESFDQALASYRGLLSHGKNQRVIDHINKIAER